VKPRKQTRSRSGSGGGGGGNEDDDGVRSIKGSTRLEAKKQRRREGRDAGRKRPSIITEAEFLGAPRVGATAR
jgi:ribonuclease E